MVAGRKPRPLAGLDNEDQRERHHATLGNRYALTLWTGHLTMVNCSTADNQGEWMGSGGIFHVKKGSFTGHPAGLRWTGMTNSPVKLTTEQFVAKIDERRRRDENGRAIKPENVVNETPNSAL